MQAVKIDSLMVQRVAELVRLQLTPQEVEVFSAQLSTIIDYFNILAATNVEDVPAAALPPTSAESLRSDIVAASLPIEEFLSLAPEREGSYVRTPKVN